MPHEDNYAFNAMNAADAEPNITGGAITYSEFEMDMSPKQQRNYSQRVLSALDNTYRGDPNKGKLGFSDWLDNLRPDLIQERARKWEETREDKDAMNVMDPEEYSVLEDSGLLQSLLSRHTGRVEDVRDIIGANVPRPIEEFKIEPTAFRQ